MKSIIAIVALLLLGACASPEPPKTRTYSAPAPQVETQNRLSRVQLSTRGGVHYIPVGISGVCCFPFVLDSGASDVSISPDLFKAMIKDGVITKEHIIDIQKYQTANGVVPGIRFVIPDLQIGTLTVKNVVGSVTPGSNVLLLGQSFLRKFKSYAINNQTHQLIVAY